MKQHEKIARVLRIPFERLATFTGAMEQKTGKRGVIEMIAEENELRVSNKLKVLGLPRYVHEEQLYTTLIAKVREDDDALKKFIGFSPTDGKGEAEKIVRFVTKVHQPQVGYFLKIEKAKEFLRAEPPKRILEALGYATVDELLAKEDILEVYSALRFMEDMTWLNKVFFRQYANLTPDDFEERPIVLRALSEKWGVAAERFVAKKYHNVSHLKELGVIFVIPVFLGHSGETLRLVALLFHYLHEVEYYSRLFTDHALKPKTFAESVVSLLRGDVLGIEKCGEIPKDHFMRFLVIQRYLAKGDVNDCRLFEPHINPEALHWRRAEREIARISEVHTKFHNGLEFWLGLGWVGDFFPDTDHETLVSFNIIDTTMGLVMQKDLIKYLYHHQEALWNRIFAQYYSYDELELKTREHILDGYFLI